MTMDFRIQHNISVLLVDLSGFYVRGLYEPPLTVQSGQHWDPAWLGGRGYTELCEEPACGQGSSLALAEVATLVSRAGCPCPEPWARWQAWRAKRAVGPAL